MQAFVSMPPSLGPTGHIVKIINALNIKRNMSPTFYKS